MVIKGIQQFQLREEFGSEEKARQTLQAAKDAGFEGIELNTFMIHKMSFAVRMLCRLAGMPLGASGNINWPTFLKEMDLKVISLHDHLDSVLNQSEQVIQQAKAFETEYIVITGMRKFDFSNQTAVHELVKKLNSAGEKLAAGGIQLLYHNHNSDFRKLPSGQSAYDYLIEQTNPAWVNFEFDSYWAAEAGCDVEAIMHRLGTRMKLYHINDRGTRVTGPTNSIIKSDSMELGYGNMNLEKYVAIAKSYGVDAIVLESHQNWADKSAIKSMQLSSTFMNQHV